MRVVCIIEKILKEEKGSAVVETSIAIPILMCVFLAGIYFLIAFRTQTVMEIAAREGSRQYQVSHSVTDIQNELNIGNVSGVKISESNNHVILTKGLQINMPIVGNYPFNLKASAEFRKENKILYYN